MTQAAVSVLVHCACGSKAWIAETFAGRKVRCRACQSVVRVPTLAPTGWEDQDARRWKMSTPSEDLVVMTPLALESTDELMLMPEVTRPSLYDDELCRPGMRRSPAEVRRITKTDRWRASARSTSSSSAEREPAGWHPRHEAHVRALSIWYGVAAALMALVTLGATVGLGRLAGGGAAVGTFLGLGTLTGLLGLLTVGLWRMRQWARWILVVFAGLNLLLGAIGLMLQPGVPELLGSLVGHGWDIGVLWVMLSSTGAQVFSAHYQSRGARHKPPVEWWFSPFFYIPIVLFVLGTLCGLALLAGGIG